MALPHAFTDLDERDTMPGIVAKRARADPRPAVHHRLSAATRRSRSPQANERFLTWADAFRRLGVGRRRPHRRDAAQLVRRRVLVARLRVDPRHRGTDRTTRTAATCSVTRWRTPRRRSRSMSERFVDRLAEVAAELPSLKTVVVPGRASTTRCPRSRVSASSDAASSSRTPVPRSTSSERRRCRGTRRRSSTRRAPPARRRACCRPGGCSHLGIALLDDLGPDDCLLLAVPDVPHERARRHRARRVLAGPHGVPRGVRHRLLLARHRQLRLHVHARRPRDGALAPRAAAVTGRRTAATRCARRCSRPSSPASGNGSA